MSCRWRPTLWINVPFQPSGKFLRNDVTLVPEYAVTLYRIRTFTVAKIYLLLSLLIKVKVTFSRYRPGVAQRVGRGIALLFHDRGTRRGWVVSSTPRPHFIPGKDPVPIVQETGWAPGRVWKGGISRSHRDSIPERPAHIQMLYRLSYRAHIIIINI